MKVMCIVDSFWISNDGNGSKCDGPEYGDICNVTKEINGAYFLSEYPDDTEGYDKRYFVPLSDIDETEMSRDYNVVKALFP